MERQIPAIILVVGPPGSGKTTLIEGLKEKFLAESLSVAIVRQDARESDRIIQRHLAKLVQDFHKANKEIAAPLADAASAVMATSRPSFVNALTIDVAESLRNGSKTVIVDFNIRSADELRNFHDLLSKNVAGCVDKPSELFVVDLIPNPAENLRRVERRGLPHDSFPDGVLGKDGKPAYEKRLQEHAINGFNCPNVKGWIGYRPGNQDERQVCAGVIKELEKAEGRLITPTSGSEVVIGDCLNNFAKTNEQRWLSVVANPRIMNAGITAEAITFLEGLQKAFETYPATISQPVVNAMHDIVDNGNINASLIPIVYRVLSAAYENGSNVLAPRPESPRSDAGAAPGGIQPA